MSDFWTNPVVSRFLSSAEFRLGEIEHLRVADATVDVIISNCVINLATDKAAVRGGPERLDSRT